MAGDLDFSIEFKVLNDQFNSAINQSRDRFSQFTQSVERNLAQMSTDSERAKDLLTGLGNVSSDRLTAEIRATADQLRQMGAGANITREQLDSAMQTAALQVTRLGRELDVARREAVRLGQTNASPTELTEAANRVNRLEQELGQARSASTSLSNELAGAMNRASTSTDNARNALYRMANIRVPETIRGEIDQINRALIDFTNNSGRPAAEIERATRAAQAEIRRLENELNGLDDTQDRVSQGAGGLGGNINKLKGAFGGLQGLLAAAGLGIGVAEIIETADAFKTLEARVKLATGAGAAFVTGFEGVSEIADETFSSVESTGELFSKIAASAETLNLAQKDVLSVTRTINEAIKLSGGSAASADAAIVQLIQGIQSGIIRGEEFNSIMEQAPRLAKAMADGLGVTRGELRGMAADGKLSSEVVINAIRSQGSAISEEFETLPTTVGNSLQVLKNQLFNFIGEIDGTLNQTSQLAEAISYIGDNLEDLDPSLVTALTGVFQNTVETVVELGKVVKGAYDDLNILINTVASGAEDANEQVGLLTASLHGVSIFAGSLADGFKAIGIAWDLVVASFYGALSDVVRVASVFSLAGILGKYKGFSDELTRLSNESWQAGEDGAMRFESSFEKAMLNAGKTAKETYTEIAEDSETTYRKMVADGEATAEQQEEALVKYALDSIKANDNVISDKLRVELAEKQLQAVIGETGKVSIESAKETTAAYLGVGQSFAEVALAGKEVGVSIQQSLYKAIEGANTKGAVEDIILSLREMGNQGKISGEDSALGFELANSKLHIIQEQTDANMVAFTDYAAEVIQKSGGITEANQNVIRSQLEQKAAAMGLAVQMSETGDITVTELDRSTLASKRTKEQIDELAGAVGVGLSTEFLKSSESLDALVDGFDDLEKAGYDAGGALITSLDQMAEKASNTVEIEALIVKWNELYKEGKITGQELADGLDNVKNRADILKDGINGVTEAYGFLGLKTREELAKDAKAYTDSYNIVKAEGKATAQQLEEAFEKTAKSNIASNNGVIDAVTARMAAERGVTVAVDEQGRVTFEKAGQAVSANDRVTSSVNRVTTSHNNLASSAGAAGTEMVRAASRAFTAYEKLQQKIKEAKEAMELKNADETLKNLRVYGKEEAPVEGNQFGSKTAVENFLKSAGLSVERAAEEARKLYAKQGTNGGALNAGALQGIRDGQMMTTQQLANFKTASVLLLEVAEKAKADEARRSKYESKLNRSDDSSNNNQNNNQSNSVDNNPAISITITKENAAQYGYVWDDKNNAVKFGQEFDDLRNALKVDQSRREAGIPESAITSYQKELAKLANNQPQPTLPKPALDAIANLNKQPNFDTSKNTGPVKTIVVELKSATGTVEATIPESQEAMFNAFVKQLQESKALAGQ